MYNVSQFQMSVSQNSNIKMILQIPWPGPAIADKPASFCIASFADKPGALKIK